MKTAIIQLISKAAFICLIFALPAVYASTEDTDPKKKLKKEQPKELSGDPDYYVSVEDFDVNQTKGIQVYNLNNVLVYKDNIESIDEIQEENMKVCLKSSEFVMEWNNIKYYVIN